MAISSKPRLRLAVAAVALVGTTGAKIPSSSMPFTKQEIAQGAEYHPQLLDEFGGTYSGPQAAYVEQIGKNIAVHTGLSTARESFTVSLLNSSVNNAFAIPGGYIYTTRQLVALMNNEAELAGVLGHEVGHVAARHSQRRQKKSTQNALLGVLGQVAGNILGGSLGGLIAKASEYTQLLTLKFSRKQELEADGLGIQYLKKAGYDPSAMATVLASLASQNALEAQLAGKSGNNVPAWASTHPDPASRVAIAKSKTAGASGITNRDVFLTKIDGLLYGDDPHQGVIEGLKFSHPDMRISFSAPAGYSMTNGNSAVTISGQGGKAEFTAAKYSGDLNAYIRSVFQAVGGKSQTLTPGAITSANVGGMQASYATAKGKSGENVVDIAVFAYQLSPTKAVHFTAITPAGGSGTFNAMYKSFARMTAAEVAAIVPRRLSVVTVKAGDTVQSLSARMAYDNGKLERFRVLNGLGSADALKVGQKVKLVVKGS